MKRLLLMIMFAIMVVGCTAQSVCEEPKEEPGKNKQWSGYVRTV